MRKESKVGLFIVIGLIIFFYLIIKVGEINLSFKNTGFTIYTDFDQTAALLKGAPVRLAGVKIGKVVDIYLKGGKAEVKMLITHDIKIRKDSKATVSSFGIMGEKYLEIIPGKTEDDFLKDGDKIEGIPPLSIDQIGSLFYSIGQNLKQVGDTIKNIFTSEEGEYRLKTILKNMAETSDQVRVAAIQIKQAIPQMLNDTKQSMNDLNEIVFDIAKRIDRLTKSLETIVNKNKGNVKGGLESFKKLSGDLEEIAKEVSKMAKIINSGEGTAGKLLKDDKLYKDIKKTVVSLKESVYRLKGIVESKDSMKIYYGFGSYYYGDSRFRNIIKTGIRKENNYLGFELTQDPYKDNFLYSVYGAKRIGAFTPMVGIIDSTFGVGLGFTPKDNLTLDFVLKDFNKGSTPYWRITGFYKIFYGFSLTGGYENRLEGNKIFFGLSYINK